MDSVALHETIAVAVDVVADLPPHRLHADGAELRPSFDGAKTHSRGPPGYAVRARPVAESREPMYQYA